MLTLRIPRKNSNISSVNSTTSDPKNPQINVAQKPTTEPMPNAEKKSFTRRILQRFGLRKNTSKGAVAAMSEQASIIRANADTAAMTLAVIAGGISAATLGAAVPFSAALLGLAVLIQRVGAQVGMNIELRSNLMIIQHEVDRFYKIAKVMEAIAEENGFELNTGSVKTFVGKLTTFIAMLANEEVAKGIQAFRQSSSSNPLQTANNVQRLNPKVFKNVIDYSQIKGTFTGLFNRTFATGEYLRQLIRDITILDVFMTILIGEFQVFFMYVGDPTKKQWATTTPEFKSMLFDTLRLAKLPPKRLNQSLNNFKAKQLALVQGKLNTTSPYKKFYTGFENFKEPTQEEFKKALAFATEAIQAAKTTLTNPQLQQEFAENKEKEEEAIKGEVESQIVKEKVLETLNPSAEEEINKVSEVAANTLTKGGRRKTRRANPTGRSRKLKRKTRRHN